METLERGQEKIDRICSALRRDVLEPAKKQAEEIVADGQREAEQLVAEARKQAEEIMNAARISIEQERNAFYFSLQHAVKQALESLRHDIENKVFSDHLHDLIAKSGAHPDLIAKLINGIVQILKRDGLATDLTVLIPHTISPQEINDLLIHDVLNVLKEKSVTIGKFAAGAQVKINNKKIVIDMSEDALVALLASFIVRADFRNRFLALIPQVLPNK